MLNFPNMSWSSKMTKHECLGSYYALEDMILCWTVVCEVNFRIKIRMGSPEVGCFTERCLMLSDAFCGMPYIPVFPAYPNTVHRVHFYPNTLIPTFLSQLYACRDKLKSLLASIKYLGAERQICPTSSPAPPIPLP